MEKQADFRATDRLPPCTHSTAPRRAKARGQDEVRLGQAAAGRMCDGSGLLLGCELDQTEKRSGLKERQERDVFCLSDRKVLVGGVRSREKTIASRFPRDGW